MEHLYDEGSDFELYYNPDLPPNKEIQRLIDLKEGAENDDADYDDAEIIENVLIWTMMILILQTRLNGSNSEVDGKEGNKIDGVS